MLGIVLLASISSAALSLVATGFGIAFFRTLPQPRRWARVGELAILALPLVLGVAFVGLLFLAW